MTSNEFIIWLKGFIAGSSNYNLTPKGWDDIKEQLDKVNTNEKSFWTVTYTGGESNVTYNTNVPSTKTL